MQAVLPATFIWRRLHSLTGLWLVIFLVEHLVVNSQAALILGENGRGFIELVNSIHNLPYLEAIELFLLSVPILIHLIWGVQYLLTGKFNSSLTNGAKPALPEYGRNRAYTWQRITSWILIFTLIGHIVKFRFLEYPVTANKGSEVLYCVRVTKDPGLYSVAHRLNAALYDNDTIQKMRTNFQAQKKEGRMALLHLQKMQKNSEEGHQAPPSSASIAIQASEFLGEKAWIEALERLPLSSQELVLVAKDFGTASLFTVRDTFKNPIYVILYTIFVLAACFHAFNGFWTFLITWGLVLKMAAQKMMVRVSLALMLLITFLGLAAVWGTYYLNLRY
jgi:succinate dehydrogenase / fumarate reductase, cytochrome b subunit